MSVKVSGLIWDHFPPERDEFVLALALADEANHDGGDIFPGVPRLAKRTRKSERTVQRQLRALERDGWLVCVERSAGGRNMTSRYQINPAWLSDPVGFGWGSGNGDMVSPLREEKPRHGVTVSEPETVTSGARNGDIAVSPAYTQKHPKEKTSSLFPTLAESGSESEDDRRLAEWIFGKVKAIAPNHRPPPWRRWVRDIRLMRERDGRTRRAIAELFAWANADPFWQSNVLSPGKLRERWDQLDLKRVAAKGVITPEAPADKRCVRVRRDGGRCGRPGVFRAPGGGYRCRECEEELEAAST